MQPIYIYQFDKNGTNPDNLIINESHLVTEASGLTIVPENGLFYTKSLIISNMMTMLPLVTSAYKFDAFDSDITAETGLEVAGAIILTDPNLSGAELLIQYQCVGGREGNNSTLLVELRDKIAAIIAKPVTWENVINKPATLPPEPHTHEILTDLTGLEAVTDVLNRMLLAIINSRGPIGSARDLNDRIDRLLALITKLRNDFNTFITLAYQRASATNYGIDRLSTVAEVMSAERYSTIVTPYTLGIKLADFLNRVNTLISNSMDEHLADNNPHPQYVRVDNQVTQTEAEDGTSDTVKSWSPLNVAQAIGVRIQALRDTINVALYNMAIDYTEKINQNTIISLNSQVINTDYTFIDGKNGESVGDVVITDGTVVTVGDANTWYLTGDGGIDKQIISGLATKKGVALANSQHLADADPHHQYVLKSVIPAVQSIEASDKTLFTVTSSAWQLYPNLTLTCTPDTDVFAVLKAKLNVRYSAAEYPFWYECVLNGGTFTNHVLGVTIFEADSTANGTVALKLEANVNLLAGVAYVITLYVRQSTHETGVKFQLNTNQDILAGTTTPETSTLSLTLFKL